MALRDAGGAAGDVPGRGAGHAELAGHGERHRGVRRAHRAVRQEARRRAHRARRIHSEGIRRRQAAVSDFYFT